MAIAFLEQNIESIKQDELRDKALKKLLKAAEITDQFETRIAGDVARIEDSCEEFKNNVTQCLSVFNTTISEQENTLSIRIDFGDQQIIEKLHQEKQNIDLELSNVPIKFAESKQRKKQPTYYEHPWRGSRYRVW